eukprot:jgi/Mesen1/8425/ME000472S07785
MVGDLLSIQPAELKFPFELKKQISCSLRVINVSSEYVAFKVKTTSPKKYCVRPNTGIVPPQSSAEVIVTMQAQREAPPDMQCKDKFLVQSVIVPQGSSSKDLTQDMWSKEAGKEVVEAKLRVVYVAPPQPPSPVAESAEEGLMSPSPFKNDSLDRFDLNGKDITEVKAKLIEARQALVAMTEERNKAQALRKHLEQELAQARSAADRSPGGAGVSSRGYANGNKQQVVAPAKRGSWFGFLLKNLVLAALMFLVGYFYALAPTPVGPPIVLPPVNITSS